ncbi:hypothetical protein M9H77_27147 [Catharanthus roseus]|uniref:Uncharacterized protein n=1 Tax=Catharanthus roseus TaxID=4058 RepID=A0ACC0ACJ7_CATRO|nr:hypothetical protein M9H77_27147 [Catharanthus roseus]
MKTSFRPGLKFVENQVNGRVSGLHCTWLVPHTRASSDNVDGGRGPTGIYVDIASCSAVGRSPSGELARNGQGPSKPLKAMFHCGAYNLPRGTQMPYSAAVDLVVGLGASHRVYNQMDKMIMSVILFMWK